MEKVSTSELTVTEGRGALLTAWLLRTLCRVWALQEKYREDEDKRRALNLLATGAYYVRIDNVYHYLRLLHYARDFVEEVGELIPTAEEVRDWYEEMYKR